MAATLLKNVRGQGVFDPVRNQTRAPRHILVVEGEPDMRRLNAKLLKKPGYEVDTVEDGKAGRAALHTARHAPECYNLLVTDNNMPELTGLALVKKLRAARMALPVIMATGTLQTGAPPQNWLRPPPADGLQL